VPICFYLGQLIGDLINCGEILEGDNSFSAVLENPVIDGGLVYDGGGQLGLLGKFVMSAPIG
jgi:hypothetical protein